MKIITHYECEFCRMQYRSKESAETCEARGRAKETRVGTIFNNASQRGNFYKNMTFVVAQNHLNGHCNDASLWAFRDNSVGDSLGLEDLCGGGNSLHLGKGDAPDQNHPTFARAVAFLKKHKIKAYVWDGTKSIEL